MQQYPSRWARPRSRAVAPRRRHRCGTRLDHNAERTVAARGVAEGKTPGAGSSIDTSLTSFATNRALCAEEIEDGLPASPSGSSQSTLATPSISACSRCRVCWFPCGGSSWPNANAAVCSVRVSGDTCGLARDVAAVSAACRSPPAFYPMGDLSRRSSRGSLEYLRRPCREYRRMNEQLMTSAPNGRAWCELGLKSFRRAHRYAAQSSSGMAAAGRQASR
jgi:hypothetical protein